MCNLPTNNLAVGASETFSVTSEVACGFSGTSFDIDSTVALNSNTDQDATDDADSVTTTVSGQAASCASSSGSPGATPDPDPGADEGAPGTVDGEAGTGEILPEAGAGVLPVVGLSGLMSVGAVWYGAARRRLVKARRV